MGEVPTPLIGNTIHNSNPEVVLLSPRRHTWLEANGDDTDYDAGDRLAQTSAVVVQVLPVHVPPDPTSWMEARQL